MSKGNISSYCFCQNCPIKDLSYFNQTFYFSRVFLKLTQVQAISLDIDHLYKLVRFSDIWSFILTTGVKGKKNTTEVKIFRVI